MATGLTNTNPVHGEYGSLDDLTTTANTYADVGTWKTWSFGTMRFYFTVTTNTLDIKVLGSADGGLTYPWDAIAEFTQAAGSVVKTNTGAFTHLKVQAKPNVADTHGTVATDYFGRSPA